MQAQIHAPRTGYAYNLLDNSDFRNPVNQRGQTTYTEGGYTIDRWKMASKDTQLTVNNGYITITNNAESGRVTVENILPENHIGEVLTVAVCDHDTGNVYCMSGTVPEVDSTESQYFCNVDFNGNTLRLLLRNSGKLSVCITVGNGASVHLRWAALYEGAYTADTLPPYQPKGYAAELAECKRYYELLDSGTSQFVRAYKDDAIAFCVDYSEKRAVPVISMTGALGNALNVAGVGAVTPTSIESAAPIGRKSARVNAMGSFDTSETYAISYGIARLSISADL